MNDIECKLINIISQRINVYKLIYSAIYLCIIIIIGTFIYWDAVYKGAKKLSKCNNISKIIDENYYNETPYVYTIIIVNTKNINKPQDYIIKITYDFHKMITTIDYGNTKNEDNVFIYRINDYASIMDDLKELDKIKNSLELRYKETKTKKNLENYKQVSIKYSLLANSADGKKAIELDKMKAFDSKFKYKYYSLERLESDIIEDINIKINSNDYKYYAVDSNYNIIRSYTTNELIKFTREFSKNEHFPITIIDYIVFSKIQQKNNIDI
jgi:hypothetical protein